MCYSLKFSYMIKPILLPFLLFISINISAQNNVFPTSGSVGIGTTAPQAKLDVNGGIISNAESHFSFGSYLDPVYAGGYAIKVGSGGIAVSGNSTFLQGKVGIGSVLAKGTLEVKGSTVLGGGNIDPRFALGDLSFLPNSYQMVVGWNRSGGGGEMDFISNQGSGIVGGFAFYNYSNSGVESQLMWIQANGNVGIGTDAPGDYKLAVNGKIHTREVNVNINNWPDYVFDPSYQKLSLSDLEIFIKRYKHLPEIPAYTTVEKDGANLGEMNAKLLKKIEELTLYLIDLKHELDEIKSKP